MSQICSQKRSAVSDDALAVVVEAEASAGGRHQWSVHEREHTSGSEYVHASERAARGS